MNWKERLLDMTGIERLAPFFSKDYTQEAMSFLPNYHRILNYWGDGVSLLPPQFEETKRRKFSFFDLVWLGLVKELRDFGMEKEKIAVLKGELLAPPDHKEVSRQLKQYRRQVEEVLANNYGVGTDQIRPILDEYLSRQLEVQKLSFSLLSIYIYYVVGRNTDVQLLIGKDGHHQFYSPDFAYSEARDGVKPSLGSHITISLRNVIHFFVALPILNDDVKQQLLSPKEWKLIEHSRRPELISIKVSYNREGEMKTVELTKKKKVAVEARLTEILLKGSYEHIEIETQNGKPVFFSSTEKINL